MPNRHFHKDFSKELHHDGPDYREIVETAHQSMIDQGGGLVMLALTSVHKDPNLADKARIRVGIFGNKEVAGELAAEAVYIIIDALIDAWTRIWSTRSIGPTRGSASP